MTFRRSRLALLLSVLVLPAGLGLAGAPASAGEGPRPTVHSFDFSPRSVDVTSEPAEVTITTRVSDATSWGRTDRSDEYLYVGFKSGVGYNKRGTARDAVILKRVSGHAGDGVYTGTYTVDRFAAPGTWSMFFHQARDSDGYSFPVLPAGAPTTLTVISGNPDLEPPQASEHTVTPSTVDVTCGVQKVVVSARITDRSGVRDPGNHKFAIGRAGPGVSGGAIAADGYMTRTSGTAHDGIYSATLSVNPEAVPGSWGLGAYTYDILGNGQYTTAGQPLKLIPAMLTITRSGRACAPVKRLVPSVLFDPNRAGGVTSLVQSPRVFPPGTNLANAVGPRMTFRGTPLAVLTVLTRTAPAKAYTKAGTVRLGGGETWGETASYNFLRVYSRTTSVMVVDETGLKSTPITLYVTSEASYPSIAMTDVRTRRTVFSGTVTPGVNGRLVTLYNRGKPWATARTNAKGAWTLVRTMKPGAYYWQVRTKTDAYNLGDDSEVSPRPHRFY